MAQSWPGKESWEKAREVAGYPTTTTTSQPKSSRKGTNPASKRYVKHSTQGVRKGGASRYRKGGRPKGKR
jgi:hypothetical protein